MISDKTVDILVQSRDASYRAALTAVVTHSITDYQLHFNINAASWRIRQNISLADPNFNQSQRIGWFDGYAKTTSGSSLNDLLLAGPTIQQKIFNILLRFRFFKVALCGDICNMYRCVLVSYPDDFLQCIA